MRRIALPIVCDELSHRDDLQVVVQEGHGEVSENVEDVHVLLGHRHTVGVAGALVADGQEGPRQPY